MTKILIAVDGSELSLDAVHHALQLVRSGLRAGEQVLLDPTVAPGTRVRAQALTPKQAAGRKAGRLSSDVAGGGTSQAFTR